MAMSFRPTIRILIEIPATKTGREAAPAMNRGCPMIHRCRKIMSSSSGSFMRCNVHSATARKGKLEGGKQTADGHLRVPQRLPNAWKGLLCDYGYKTATLAQQEGRG